MGLTSGDVDMTQVMYGIHARHIPAWFWVQDGGDGVATIIGSSRVPDGPHPLKYGSERTHQLIVGEIIVRPHVVIATDEKRGAGLSGLVDNVLWNDPDIVLDPLGRAQDILKEVLR